METVWWILSYNQIVAERSSGVLLSSRMTTDDENCFVFQTAWRKEFDSFHHEELTSVWGARYI
jgi:hypothetical protein